MLEPPQGRFRSGPPGSRLCAGVTPLCVAYGRPQSGGDPGGLASGLILGRSQTDGGRLRADRGRACLVFVKPPKPCRGGVGGCPAEGPSPDHVMSDARPVFGYGEDFLVMPRARSVVSAALPSALRCGFRAEVHCWCFRCVPSCGISARIRYLCGGGRETSQEATPRTLDRPCGSCASARRGPFHSVSVRTRRDDRDPAEIPTPSSAFALPPGSRPSRRSSRPARISHPRPGRPALAQRSSASLRSCELPNASQRNRSPVER